MSLVDRLELAAQACRAAHLLSCEATCREAITSLESVRSEALEEAAKLCETQAPFLPSLAVALRVLNLQSTARVAEGWREGFYEKLWKDFVSIQRGDAQGILAKVERYYRETAPESPAKEQPWQRTRREVLIEAAMKCRDIQYEHLGPNYDNAAPDVKCYHNGMAKGADCCEYAIRQLADNLQSSPAKGQPGEQNAAPAGGGSQPVDTSTERDRGHAHVVPSESPILAVPRVAAPDVAAMVEEIRYFIRNVGQRVPSQVQLEQWAALIEKLGQSENQSAIINWTTEGCPKHHGHSWIMGMTPVHTILAKRCPICEERTSFDQPPPPERP